MEQPFTLIIDVDGTLCPIKQHGERYEDLVPYGAMVEKIRSYHNEGAKIVLFSSRNMNSYDGNLGLINKYTAKTLMDWLLQWNIPYDEIFFGKPWPGHKGFYVDDRSVRPKEFLTHTPDELKKICDGDREGLE